MVILIILIRGLLYNSFGIEPVDWFQDRNVSGSPTHGFIFYLTKKIQPNAIWTLAFNQTENFTDGI